MFGSQNLPSGKLASRLLITYTAVRLGRKFSWTGKALSLFEQRFNFWRERQWTMEGEMDSIMFLEASSVWREFDCQRSTEDRTLGYTNWKCCLIWYSPSGISLSWLSLSISSLRDLMLAIPTGISSRLLLDTSRDSNIERWQISSLKNQGKKASIYNMSGEIHRKIRSSYVPGGSVASLFLTKYLRTQ